ncbi:MFS transporter [Desertimonas flava]|uniref:MFS transporter n=1 Tax=Desertimonas flava TaxID=2064846 RepID=UPI000E34666E|nr:MFS transporter [Desertimonas flava]
MSPRTSDRSDAIDPAVYARRWQILIVLCLSLTVVMVANGSLNVALPILADSLGASSSSLQWMVDSYALVFAGMLFAAGTLGDRFGRKRALQFGLVLFLGAALFAVQSDTANQIIGARAVMGFAAAFVMPSTLSLLANVFPAEERGRAIALWAGIAAGGAALGPPTSGFLVEHFWWGSVFLVNVPVLVIAIVAGRILLPESRDPDGHRIDLPGVALSIVGIGALVYAIIEAPAKGWLSAHTMVVATVAVVALLLFAARELTAREPMVDFELFRNRAFSGASFGIAVSYLVMFGMMFLLTQYLQMVLGYSPFGAGLLMLPMSLTMMVLAPQAAKVVARHGVARVVPVGMSLVAAGLVALSFLDTDSPGPAVYLALGPMIVGLSSTTPALTATIMSAVPRERAGVGSAMNDTTRELGGALGVAVLGSLVTTRFHQGVAGPLESLPPATAAEVDSGLAGALRAADSLPGEASRELSRQARESFTAGLGTAALVAAGLVVLAALILRSVLATKAPLADRDAEIVDAIECGTEPEVVAVGGR